MIGEKEPLHGMGLQRAIITGLGQKRRNLTIQQIAQELGVQGLTEQELNAAGYTMQRDGTFVIGQSA